MSDRIINEIVEVKTKENELRKRKAELEILRDCILEEIKEICKEMWELEKKERYLKEEFRKEHTREFYQPMDEIDICRRIKTDGLIKGMKF